MIKENQKYCKCCRKRLIFSKIPSGGHCEETGLCLFYVFAECPSWEDTVEIHSDDSRIYTYEWSLHDGGFLEKWGHRVEKKGLSTFFMREGSEDLL